MSAKLKAATVIAGGALTTLAIPAANAQAAPPPGPAGLHAGLTAPHPKSAGSGLGSTTHSKVATPDASCGGGDVTWQDNYDNRYLQIHNSGKANGNWADAYPGNGTCTQHWFAVASGSTSFFTGGAYLTAVYGMVNTNSEKCLAAPDTNIGNAHVVQESCGYSHYNYRWAEASDTNGWLLVEPVLNGNWIPSPNDFAAACEDVANHWIYTSHYSNAWTANNCIWH